MTLGDVVRSRRQRAVRLQKGIDQPWWEGYYSGWYDAYKDLAEICKQNGFDIDSVVIK